MRKGFQVYDDQIESYSKSDANGLEGLSRFVRDEALDRGMAVEEDIDTLKAQIGNDIRKNIPPQLYAVVSGIAEAIAQIEDDAHEG